MVDADIIVVGAGPVGMVATLLAANHGLEVMLLERSAERHRQSRAIGITPPSLEILQRIGLCAPFIASGIAVRSVRIHNRFRMLCTMNFDQLPGEFPYVLAIPQHMTEALLEESVARTASIHLLRGHAVQDLSTQGDRVSVYGTCGQESHFHFTCRFLLGCDGGRSTTRSILEIPFKGAADPHTFLMGDFEDSGIWGEDACFFLHREGLLNHFLSPNFSGAMY